MSKSPASRLSWLKRYRLWLILAAFAIAAIVWWRISAAQPDAPAVLTATVTRGDIEVSVLASGRIEASKQVDVGAQASGQVQKLHVALGDTVKKGDLLAEIDPTVTRNEFDEAQASIDNLLAQQEAAKLDLLLAERENQRQQDMLAADATPKKTAEDAAIAVRSGRAKLAQIAAQIKQLQIRLDTARANLGYTRIVAPMAGQVVSITTQEGQTVNAAQSAPTILTLAQMDPITVRAQVAEADVTRLSAGMPLYFTVLGAPDRQIAAMLRTIEPTPQTINDAIFYNALFDVPNAHTRLRLQMTTQVSFVIARVDNALTIPVTALAGKGDSGADGQRDAAAGERRNDGAAAATGERKPRAGESGKRGEHRAKRERGEGERDGGRPQLRTVRVKLADGSIAEREVEIGLNNNVVVEVKAGLKEGDEVVTGGGLGNTRQREGGNRRPGPGF
ncbi:MAG TPA: efflux RND transporter periplasmic adaptor subunit [Chitinolyticbacter sp.]|nr:efflux RND transporter periplasmic adaptor subunit [Chitinolyticbacter sp.]